MFTSLRPGVRKTKIKAPAASVPGEALSLVCRRLPSHVSSAGEGRASLLPLLRRARTPRLGLHLHDPSASCRPAQHRRVGEEAPMCERPGRGALLLL